MKIKSITPEVEDKLRELTKEETKQLKIIKSVLGKSEIPYYRFNFGKYNGKLLKDVIKDNKQYIFWLLSEGSISDTLRRKLKEALNA